MVERLILPPHIAEGLMRIAKERRPDVALLTIIHDYLNLKLEVIDLRLKKLEEKYGMGFEEFEEACRDGTLNKDVYSYEVEEDYRLWEELVTLKRYYEELRREWSTKM